MPGINLIFSSPVFCRVCGVEMAKPQAYAQLSDSNGAVILFDDAKPPAALVLELECKNDHRSKPPDDIRLEWSFLTDRDRPPGCRAIAVSWVAARPRAMISFYRFMAKTRPLSRFLWFLIIPAIYAHGLFHDSKAYVIALAAYIVFTLLLAVFPWEVYLENTLRTQVKFSQ